MRGSLQDSEALKYRIADTPAPVLLNLQSINQASIALITCMCTVVRYNLHAALELKQQSMQRSCMIARTVKLRVLILRQYAQCSSCRKSVDYQLFSINRHDWIPILVSESLGSCPPYHAPLKHLPPQSLMS
eukprot:6194623-Pleurochrysis_carterae.AAC.2